MRLPALCALAMLTAFAARAEAVDCRPYRIGEIVTSDLPVSTFHHKGVIAPPRPHTLHWPREARIFGPGVRNGRAVEPHNDMGFHISIETGAPARNLGDHPPDLMSIAITGVDYYPLYSYVGFYGGQRKGRTLLRRQDGTTYKSSEGYAETGKTLPGGWVEIRYPKPRVSAWDRNVFVRWKAAREADAIVVCSDESAPPTSLCTLIIKDEPLLARTQFERTRMPDLSLIERRARAFTRCLMQERS